MEKMNCGEKRLPKLEGTLFFSVSPSVTDSQIVEVFGDVHIDCYDESKEIVYKKTGIIESWEINDLLTVLINLCDKNLIFRAEDELNANAWIDISFQHFEKYPALIFEGPNMRFIHDVKANISIDLY